MGESTLGTTDSAAEAAAEASSVRAVHQAVVKAAMFAGLVGQFHHHFPDVDLPADLAAADGAAFDDAVLLLDIAGQGGHYDLAAITQVAFATGRAHHDGECVFCRDEDLDELVAEAVRHGHVTASVLSA